MAGPGGVEVGRASIKVLPDLSNFFVSLEKFVQRVERQVVIRIPTSLDPKGVQEDIDRVRRQVQDAPAPKIPIIADTDGFAARVQADVRRATAAIEVDIPITADGERLRRDVQVKVQRIQAELRQLSLSVPLDAGEAAKARGEILAKVAEIQALVKRDPVEIPVKPDFKIDEASLNAFKLRLRLINLPDLKIGTSLTAGAKIGGIAALGITAAAAVPQLLALSGSITNVIGVAGLLPALGTAGAGAVGALALGFHGLGAALASANTPAGLKASSAAMKDLAPSAREAVIAIKALSPEFKALQQSVQGRLFADLGPAITNVTKSLLPELTSGLGNVAGGFNTLIQGIASSFASLGGKGLLSGIFDNTGAALKALTPGVGALITSLTQVSAVGSGFLQPLAAGFSKAATEFGKFITTAANNGSLGKFIDTGLKSFGQLADVAFQAGRAIVGLVQAAQAAGGGTLATFAAGLTQIADTINGPAFQAGLTSFFAGIQTGSAGLLAGALPAIGALFASIGPTLGTAVATIGPALGQIIGALAPLAGAIINTLLPALSFIVVGVAPVISQLAASLTPVITALGPVFAQLGIALAQLLPMLVPVIALIGQGLVTALTVVVPFIVQAITAFTQWATSATGVQTTFSPLVGFVTGTLVPAFMTIVTAFQQIAAFIIPIVMQVVAVIVANWPAISAIFVQVGQIIGAVITAIGASLQAFVAVASALWSIFGGTIMTVVRAVFPIILSIISNTLNIVKGIFTGFTALLQGNWSGLWASIRSILDGGVAIVKSLMGAGFSALIALVSGPLDSIKSAVSSKFNEVVATVQGIPGRLVSALGSLGGLLVDAGAALIDGLAQGITSRLGSVVTAASNVASSIKGLFGGSPVEYGPLLGWNNGGAGKNLVQMGLIDGIKAQSFAVAAASRDMASGLASSTSGIGFGAGAGQQPVGSGSVNFYGNVGWDPDEVGQRIASEQRKSLAVFNLDLVAS